MIGSVYRITISIAFLCLVLPALAFAQSSEFSGEIVEVIDGDTIDIMHAGKTERVRLFGVDAPELNQVYGAEAKQFTSAKATGKTARVAVRDTDRDGHTVADVYLPDGKRLGEELVAAGMAWWRKNHAPKDTELQSRHLDAVLSKVGLWNDPLPVAPWDFREGKGSSASQSTDAPIRDEIFSEEEVDNLYQYKPPKSQSGSSVGQPWSQSPPQSNQKSASTKRRQQHRKLKNKTMSVYVTKKGKTYHRAGCRKLKERKIQIPWESANVKFKACRICKPG